MIPNDPHRNVFSQTRWFPFKVSHSTEYAIRPCSPVVVTTVLTTQGKQHEFFYEVRSPTSSDLSDPNTIWGVSGPINEVKRDAFGVMTMDSPVVGRIDPSAQEGDIVGPGTGIYASSFSPGRDYNYYQWKVMGYAEESGVASDYAWLQKMQPLCRNRLAKSSSQIPARSSTTPGSATVQPCKLEGGAIINDGGTVTCYSWVQVPSQTTQQSFYIFIQQDPYGTWWWTGEDCPPLEEQ